MNFVWFFRWLFVEPLNLLINLLTRCRVDIQIKRIYFRYQQKKKTNQLTSKGEKVNYTVVE